MMPDLKKRSLTDDTSCPAENEEQTSNKRVAVEEPQLRPVEETMVMKLLCPNHIIGAVIGRGGSVLSAFQETTNTKIKISQNKDFYPETNDRVIVVTGQPDAVIAGVSAVLEKICETMLSHDAKSVNGDPELCVRILIPRSASGVIIGRSGSSIKDISAASNARLKLSDNHDPFQTNERIVSITSSNTENIKQATTSIIAILLDNRDVGNFINVSSSYTSLGSNAPLSMFSNVPSSLSADQYNFRQFHAPPSLSTAPHSSNSFNSLHPPSTHFNNEPSFSLRQSVAPSLTTQQSPNMQSNRMFRSVPSTSSTSTQEIVTQVLVPDHLVGAVLGKGGHVLKSIISNTGARIKVSNKGDFVAGTTNRSVTIEGNQDQVQSAHTAILNQLSNVQSKHA